MCNLSWVVNVLNKPRGIRDHAEETPDYEALVEWSQKWSWFLSLSVSTLFVWLHSTTLKSTLALWLGLANRIWRKWCCTISGPRPQNILCAVALFLETPLLPHEKKLGLACWRMRDHMEQSWVSPVLPTEASGMWESMAKISKITKRAHNWPYVDTWVNPPSLAQSSRTVQPTHRLIRKNKYLLLWATEGLWLFVTQHYYGNR